MGEQRNWTRNELLAAFSLYCRLPFGLYHRLNPDVRQLATALGRTPSAVAMRLGNFASLDPVHQLRGVKGLASTGPALKAFWLEVRADWNQAAVDSEIAWQNITGANVPAIDVQFPSGPTEVVREVRTRLVQGFFRRTVVASYNAKCAVCGIRPDALLSASHIIPWNEDEARRADPTNGLCLCALHDRAFDRGLISVDSGFKLLVSSRLRVEEPTATHREALLAIEGSQLSLPNRFFPDPTAVEWHRNQVFVA